MANEHMKLLLPSAIILCLAFCACPTCKAEPATTLAIINDSAGITVDAYDTALADIVKEISDKFNLCLKSGDSLTERLTVRLKAESLPAIFQHLLSAKNYTLIYGSTGSDQSKPVEVVVLGEKPASAVNSFCSKGPAPDQMDAFTLDSAPPGNKARTIGQDQFEKLFGNVDELRKQMNAIPDVNGQYISGIRVMSLAKESALSQLGIELGDVIIDVNGQKVQSTDQFIRGLKSTPGELITIGRMRNGRDDPIYIHLR